MDKIILSLDYICILKKRSNTILKTIKIIICFKVHYSEIKENFLVCRNVGSPHHVTYTLPLWVILACRSFMCLSTLSGITSTVLLSITNATQWILSFNSGFLMYPAESDSKGTKGLNYNIKQTQLKMHCKCVWIAA